MLRLRKKVQRTQPLGGYRRRGEKYVVRTPQPGPHLTGVRVPVDGCAKPAAGLYPRVWLRHPRGRASDVAELPDR